MLFLLILLLQGEKMTKLQIDTAEFHVSECRIWGELELIDSELQCRWFFTAVSDEQEISYEDELDSEVKETVRPELSCVDLPLSTVDSDLFKVHQSRAGISTRGSLIPAWSLYVFDHAECSDIRMRIEARRSDAFYVRFEGKTMPILGNGRMKITFSLDGNATFDGLILRHECTSDDRPDSHKLLGLVNKHFPDADYLLQQTSFEAYDPLHPKIGEAIYRFSIKQTP